MYYNSCYGRTMPQIYQTPMMNYSEEAKKQPEQNTKTSIVPEPEKTETPAQSVSTPAITTNTNTKTVTNISITTKQPSSSTNGSTNNIRKPQTPTSVPPATLLTKPTLKPLTSNGDLNEIYIHLNLKDTISKTKIQK